VYAQKVKFALGGDSWYYEDLSKEEIENIERLQTAREVRDVLAQSASYNLYLDAVPEGEDTVQYFLTTGRKGYCMHFASAGVLILQEMGIPARYVSGYVVKESSFVKDGTGYKADILDRNGHAWAEIYLNGVGWIPFEMTPGYASDEKELPTDEKNQEKLRQEYTKKTDAQVQQEETEGREVTEETETVQVETEVGMQAEPQETQATDVEKPSAAQWILYIVVALLVAAGSILLAGPQIRAGRLVQSAGFRQKHGRQAVALMNRRIYKHIRNRVPKTDAQYLQRLIRNYPAVSREDWEQFLVIVQKVSFSVEEVTHEEVEFCYRIYRTYRESGR
jgi:hypothetical protein